VKLNEKWKENLSVRRRKKFHANRVKLRMKKFEEDERRIKIVKQVVRRRRRRKFRKV
jgi:hypothetical protein